MIDKMRTRNLRSVAVGAVALGVVASTAAMSSGAPQEDAHVAEEGFSALVQTALDHPDVTPAERDALNRAMDNGEVQALDNEAAHERYESCMTDAGYEPRFRQSTKGFYVELPYKDVKDVAALDAAVAECSVGTGTIEALYRVQQANPASLPDGRAVAVECLAEEGFTQTGYTVEEFERDFNTDSLPFDATVVEANDCLYGAGYAYFSLDE